VRPFLRDSLGVAASQYVARAAVLARGVVAAAALGPLGFGGWNALNLILDYGNYATAGAQQGLELKLPSAAAQGDRTLAARRMAGAWSVILIAGAVFAAGVLLYLACGGRGLETGWGWGPPALMLLVALLQLTLQYHLTALRAHGEFATASTAQAAQAVVGAGLGLAFVRAWGVWALIGGWLVGTLLGLVWMRRSPVRVPLLPGHLGEGVALARLGLPVFAFFTVSVILRSLDRLTFVQSGATEALGRYSIGLMAAGLILYLPEAAAAVLYPRIAAMAHGARDRARTVAEVLQAHRALGVVLPALVGVAALWAGPIVTRVLPEYRDGVPALRALALGSMWLGVATLFGYFALASGSARVLLAMSVVATLCTAALLLGAVARGPRINSIALAQSAGYVLFALGLSLVGVPRLFAGARERVACVVRTFAPAAWMTALVVATAFGRAEAPGSIAVRTLIVLALYAPVAWWMGRGLGIGRLAGEWITRRPASA
jgi:O-antigen/teichoic acid export membrane protein